VRHILKLKIKIIITLIMIVSCTTRVSKKELKSDKKILLGESLTIAVEMGIDRVVLTESLIKSYQSSEYCPKAVPSEINRALCKLSKKILTSSRQIKLVPYSEELEQTVLIVSIDIPLASQLEKAFIYANLFTLTLVPHYSDYLYRGALVKKGAVTQLSEVELVSYKFLPLILLMPFADNSISASDKAIDYILYSLGIPHPEKLAK